MGHEGERAAEIQLRALTTSIVGGTTAVPSAARPRSRAGPPGNSRRAWRARPAAWRARRRSGGRPECGVAEQVVGMDVARDHEADRPCGDLPDGRVQASAGARAAAGVDHRDRLVPEHEPDVRDVTEIQASRARAHHDARRRRARSRSREVVSRPRTGTSPVRSRPEAAGGECERLTPVQGALATFERASALSPDRSPDRGRRPRRSARCARPPG